MLEVNDPNGKKQFDVEMFAYKFANKGSFTTINVGDGSMFPYMGDYGSSSSVGPYDLVAFSCSTSLVTLNNTLFDNADSSKTIAAVHRNTTSSQTVNWWTFRSMRNFSPSSSLTGIQLMNGQGKLIYENTTNPLKVVTKVDVSSIGSSGQHYGWNGPNGITVNGSGSLPAGRQYAFLPFGTVTNLDNQLGVRLTSSGYEYGPVYTTRNNKRTLFNGGFLVVDVTGY